MKRILTIILMTVLLIPAFAQTSEKKWGIGAGVGAYGTLKQGGIGFMPELYLSRYLSPRLDLMLKGDMGLFNSKLDNNLDIFNPSLNLRLKLSDEAKKFRPYLYAGPGILKDNHNSGLNFNIGLGSKYYVSPSTALYFDAGYINGIEVTRAAKQVKDNFLKATLGIEYDFGKAKDSDMDGVADKKDKCPDTPAGVAVDANGCPLDSDGDGVADYIDECPTVAGLTSLKGCPDRDKDGIADKDDACPDTPGLTIFKGCPDTDGDGVIDSNDKCPNTPKGWKVDASGCPSDKDKDGIYDEEDKCPTVAGPKENNGCPIEVEKKKEITADQIEIQNIKVEPVHFQTDKFNLTDYSKGILNKLVKTLNSNPSYNINVSGHTDSQGSDEHNDKLSQDRVNSVIRYLKSNGISEERIISQKAFGKAKPIADNKTAAGRLKNRRVEFEIFKMK